jgi:hypothetical protein
MAEPFQPKFFDLVRNYTDTEGTDDFLLGAAATGFTSFVDACQPGDQFYYSAVGVEKPDEREVGRGTLLTGGVVAREPVGGVKTAFSSGSKSLALVAASEWYDSVDELRAVEQPIVFSDFKNGIYKLGGERVAYGDLWQPAVGLPEVVPGVGWTFTDTGAGGDFYSAATDAVNQAVKPGNGLTVVMDCSINTPDVEGSRSVMVGLSAYNDPTDDKYGSAAAYHDPPSWGGTGGALPYMSTTDGTAFQSISLGDVHRFAASLGPNGEAISVDGGPVRSAPAATWGADIDALYLESVIENSGIKDQVIVVERVAIFPLMESELLPRLSARAVPTPSGLTERIALARAFGTGVVIGQNAEPKSHTGDTVETVLAKVTLPGRSMGAHGRLSVEALFSHTANDNGKTPRITFGGQTLSWGFDVAAGRASSAFGNSIHNRGSHSKQAYLSPGSIYSHTTGLTSPVVTATVDTSQDVDITFTGQLDVATDTIALESYQVVLFPSN